MSEAAHFALFRYPTLLIALSPPRPLAPSVIAAILCLCVFSVQLTTAAEPWKEMDYGPFLSTTLLAPYPPPKNVTCKAIIIPLKPDRSVNVAFDTDLLRYSAGWSGGFVDWKNIAFDGQHEASQSLDGQQIFGNGAHPGWANADGKFDDPRAIPFGPLPREQYEWKGLYLSGGAVVLSYRVNGCDILEQPGFTERDGNRIFTRNIRIGPTAHDLILQVSEGKNPKPISRRVDQSDAGGQIVVQIESPGLSIAVACARDTQGCEWDLSNGEEIRLRIAAQEKPRNIEVMISPWTYTFQTISAKPVTTLPDWDKLAHGGPPRWKKKLTTEGRIGKSDGPYAIDTITAPHENPWHARMRFTGFDFFKDGHRAAICTWNGDVWLVDGIDESLSKLTWQRIATGLFEPLGLKIVDEQIYVLGRDQITRLHDLNDDGETDFYENFNNDHQVSEHFHEFAMDLQTGPDGDFYYMKAARHALEAVVPQHGTLLHVSKDGKHTEIVCNGFRAPNGLGISPTGDMITSDQEGHWMPMNRINWLEPGKFYGNMYSYHATTKPTTYDPPLCWVPNWFDRSPAAPVWITSDKWGAGMKGGLLSLSYGTGRISKILHEKVNGMRQGGSITLPVVFDTGIIRGRFHPIDGQLYACGMFGSWGSDKTGEGQFGRVRYTGNALHVPTALHATQYGMVVTFTNPLDADTAADPQNYLVERWNYQWTERYGSEDYRLSDGQRGRDRVPVTGVKLSSDRRSVFLQIPDMRPCMQMQIKYNIRAADKTPLSQNIVNTIHVLGPPDLPDIEFEGGLTSPPPVPPEQVRVEDLEPGLALRFARALRSRDAESEEPLDMRVSRLLALAIPEAAPPSPFVKAGAFSATFEGYIQTELPATYTFEAEGRGRFALYINEKEVCAPANLPTTSGSVDMPAGLSRIRARFITDNRPGTGEARLRMYWKSKDISREPIPPTVLFHERRTSAMEAFERLHQGRELLTSRHCLKCHTPDQAESLKKSGMIELSMDAPELAGLGSRLNLEWLAHWLLDPRKMRADAHMPAMLYGPEKEQQAADIAAYLSTLTDDSSPSPTSGDTAKGQAYYEAFGCMACHTLAKDEAADQHNRLSLRRTKAKYKPEALKQYLLQPERHYQWTRMPNFHLTGQQAADLAAYLFADSDPALEPIQSSKEPSSDRGQALIAERGCLNCHTFPLITNQYTAPRLSQLQNSDWARACLAKQPGVERAPDFGLSDAQREALQSLARTDLGYLQRRDMNEFANRQMKNLRCTACHGMDNKADIWLQLMNQAEPQASEEDEEDGEGNAPIKQLARMLGIEKVNDVQVRPSLTWAGEKFHVEWMAKFIAGAIDQKPRPGLLAKMPSFPAYAEPIARGLAQQHGAEVKLENEPAIDPEMVTVGEELIGTEKGFACTTCHAVGKQPPVVGSTLQAINFSMIHRRLRKEYYWLWIFDPQRIEPGSMMPRFVEEDWRSPFTAHYEGDARKQFEAVWHYLRSVDDSLAPSLPIIRPGQE